MRFYELIVSHDCKNERNKYNTKFEPLLNW